jgi:hypothetical protein
MLGGEASATTPARMMERSMTPRPKIATLVLATLALMLAAACATTNAPAPPNERLLSEAGFKSIPATTPQQQQHLQALPPGTLTEWQQTGKHYYVYPDVAANKLYVGTPKEYQAYLGLRTKNGLANPAPANTTTADMRSYLKQDAAMQKADALDAQIPPWAIWPDFANLGWIP